MFAPTSTNLELTDGAVRAAALDRLTKHMPLHVEGWTCTTEMVLDVLVKAAATGKTIEAVCKELDNVADSNTIREYLNQQIRITELRELERRVNRALTQDLPARVWNTECDVIFDLTDDPFYGKDPELRAYACRGEARDGTTHFFRVATAYVIVKHVRVTLAVLFVTPEDDLRDIVEALYRRLKILEVTVRYVLLDKGFHSIAMMHFLKRTGWRVILACPIRGKQGGLRAKCQGIKSYVTKHTFVSAAGTFTACVILCRTLLKGKRQRHRWIWLAFVVFNATLTPRQVRRLYRRRFGIESSYRCRRKARARTASRNAALRFLLMGLSFILLNLWLQLRWWYAQRAQRGRRAIDAARFELQRMLSFLNHAIEAVYGVVRSITADVHPLQV